MSSSVDYGVSTSSVYYSTYSVYVSIVVLPTVQNSMNSTSRVSAARHSGLNWVRGFLSLQGAGAQDEAGLLCCWDRVSFAVACPLSLLLYVFFLSQYEASLCNVFNIYVCIRFPFVLVIVVVFVFVFRARFLRSLTAIESVIARRTYHVDLLLLPSNTLLYYSAPASLLPP